MENSTASFFETWDAYLILGAYACFGISSAHYFIP